MSFLKKYRPHRFEDYLPNQSYIDALKLFIKMDCLTVLIIGNNGSGRTTLIHTILREYYGTDTINDDNILFINRLHDQGIRYFRTEVKTFCQTSCEIPGKKKSLILDDIDIINEQCQQVFRNYIDKYSSNINFIASCVNTQKVIDSIQSRCTIVKIKPFGTSTLNIIYNKIMKEEKLNIDSEAGDFILNVSNNSIRLLLNYLEKIKIYDGKITIFNVKEICTHISFNDFDEYTRLWNTERDLDKAIAFMFKIQEKGYSVMDILDDYFLYIKTIRMNELYKYEIIKIVCKYITIFHTVHEDDLELACLTYDLFNFKQNHDMN